MNGITWQSLKIMCAQEKPWSCTALFQQTNGNHTRKECVIFLSMQQRNWRERSRFLKERKKCLISEAHTAYIPLSFAKNIRLSPVPSLNCRELWKQPRQLQRGMTTPAG